MRRIKTFSAIATASLLFAAGCSTDDGTSTNGPIPVDPAGTHTTYVIDQLNMPTTQTQASEYGLNIDGDEAGRPDNALGKILAALGGAADQIDVQASVDDQISRGEIILLNSMQSTDLNLASGAGFWVFLGDNPSTAPCKSADDTVCGDHLNGNTAFDLSASSPKDTVISGDIVNGRFEGGPGNVTIEIALIDDSAPLRLNLIGARADLQVDETGLRTGRLGGAITEDDLQSNVIPTVHALLVDSSAADCTGGDTCCVPDSSGALIYDLFDENGDCDLTLQEVRENSLISSLLAPDVDLLDANGNFNPLQDGIKDALSVGVGFTSVGADFRVPVE